MTDDIATDAGRRDPPYFFDGGLRFECQRCGRCCTGAPGIVRVDEAAIAVISDFLRLTREAFIERFTHRVGPLLSLRERPDGACIFYQSGCTIYPVRPVQCRTFPFWVKNLRSEEAWREVEKSCPGIGQGHLHERQEILATVADSPV